MKADMKFMLILLVSIKIHSGVAANRTHSCKYRMHANTYSTLARVRNKTRPLWVYPFKVAI